ncbi:MAG: hypothetical protein H5U07_01490 [Candidatus Aminicenantes bacterium]|nr:hypothetical protein [Candidatus Aminicenantes bacterium]
MSPKGNIAAILAFIILFGTSCLVYVEKVDQQTAARRFAKAVQKIEKISASRPRVPHKLVCLVYDSEEAQLVKISLPYWMAKKGVISSLEEGNNHGPKKADYQFETRAVEEALSKMPVGLLVEVVDEDERVLVWLE